MVFCKDCKYCKLNVFNKWIKLFIFAKCSHPERHILSTPWNEAYSIESKSNKYIACWHVNNKNDCNLFERKVLLKEKAGSICRRIFEI